MKTQICLVLFVFFCSCQRDKPLFKNSENTGVSFSNQLTESEKENILSYEYFYNGGGLGSGDFNNDGLVDLYFSGNQVANVLYINKGALKFEPLECGVKGKKNSWKTGVSVIDINKDGWLDIYLCYSGIGNAESRKNELYINQGSINGKWTAKFVEQAAYYGLADEGRSTQAAFFDYDLDGDLDAYVLNHNLKDYQRKEAAVMKSSVDSLAGDRFYENVGGKFVNKTIAVGIKSNPLGFGLGIVITDVNNDRYPDIYIANDYVEEDYLYINDKQGRFKESGKTAIGHFSYSSMGVDAADVNNDGLVDLFTCDMLPPDSPRQKKLAFPDNWNVQQSMLQNGFHWQNMRNMLQINKSNEESIHFNEEGQLAGVSATDWSWGPLLGDLDNDGFKDLFISNGFYKDLTDLDFVKDYLDQDARLRNGRSVLETVKAMPSTPTHHFVFKNKAGEGFEDMSGYWGFDESNVASGSVEADLDNDGDLDIVTNNTNSVAKVYENRNHDNGYLKIENAQIGDRIEVFVKNKRFSIENYPVRGFQSSSSGPLLVGIGKAEKIDSVVLSRLPGKVHVWKNSTKNAVLNADAKTWEEAKFSFEKSLFNRLLQMETVLENEFLDFNRQILLPKKQSDTGPVLAKADINNDGKEDLFVSGQIYVQGQNSSFSKTNFKTEAKLKAALFVDVNKDGYQDLYLACGGYEYQLEGPEQQDQLWLNNQKGEFKPSLLPAINMNESKILAFDIDNDQDLDLILGAAVRPGLYPYADSSYVLINNGKGNFTVGKKMDWGVVTGMVIIENSIMITAEFKALQKISLTEFTSEPIGLSSWFTTLSSADLDGDGDMDLIVGGIGNNTSLKASKEYPLSLWSGDPDQNMIIDLYMGQQIGNNMYPIYGRDEMLEQSTFLKKKYPTYRSFSEALFKDVFDENAGMEKHTAQNIESGVFWNNKGTFEFSALPYFAQASTCNQILVEDVNNDGLKDLIMLGNDAGFRIRIGKSDAAAVKVLIQRPKGVFLEANSGIFTHCDVKSGLFLNKILVLGILNKGVELWTKI